MKKTLRIIAVLVALLAAGYWFVTGANLGWTKTQVAVKTADEVTGIEGFSYEKKFVPGVDFMTAGIGSGVLLFAISFAFKNKNQKQTPST
jgi:hypothetical protein